MAERQSDLVEGLVRPVGNDGRWPDGPQRPELGHDVLPRHLEGGAGIGGGGQGIKLAAGEVLRRQLAAHRGGDLGRGWGERQRAQVARLARRIGAEYLEPVDLAVPVEATTMVLVARAQRTEMSTGPRADTPAGPMGAEGRSGGDVCRHPRSLCWP
jgi:hypothetical protein